MNLCYDHQKLTKLSNLTNCQYKLIKLMTNNISASAICSKNVVMITMKLKFSAKQLFFGVTN